MSCPTDLALERYLLAEPVAERDHIAGCERCQATLADKRRIGDAYVASAAARSLARRLALRSWAPAVIAVAAAIAALLIWPRQSTREIEVAAVEQAWMTAIVDHDVAALDAILAPDYTLTDGAGRVTTKAQDLAAARTGRVHFDAYTSSDVEVRVTGDRAVVTGKSDLRGTNGGVAFAHAITFTDTFARIDGRWRAVAAQVAPRPRAD